MDWEHDVYSTTASKIGYNSETFELFVTWKNGKRSVYSGVPQDVAEQVAFAPSVGQALNSRVKDAYSHRYG